MGAGAAVLPAAHVAPDRPGARPDDLPRARGRAGARREHPVRRRGARGFRRAMDRVLGASVCSGWCVCGVSVVFNDVLEKWFVIIIIILILIFIIIIIIIIINDNT